MNEIKNLLSPIAPTLAAALGTPLHALSSSILSDTVGITPDGATDEQMKAILQNANSYTQSRIRDADNKFALEIEKVRRNPQQEINRNANIREEGQSSDSFVSRARPAFLYLFYFILSVIVVVMPCIGIFLPQEIDPFYKGVAAAFAAIPNELWGVFVAGYLGYSGVRTYEKTKGISK